MLSNRYCTSPTHVRPSWNEWDVSLHFPPTHCRLPLLPLLHPPLQMERRSACQMEFVHVKYVKISWNIKSINIIWIHPYECHLELERFNSVAATLPGCPCKDRSALWAHPWVQQSSWCRFSIFVEGVPAISLHSFCLHNIIFHIIFHEISAESKLNEFLLMLRSTSERISPDRPGAAKPVQKIRILMILPLRLLSLLATSSWSGLVKVVSSLVGHYTADELQNRQVRRRKELGTQHIAA